MGGRRGKLTLLNPLLRGFRRRGSHMLVHGVDSVQCDARLASVLTADGDACIASLGGIEELSRLNLDARLHARELQIVAAIERQLIDLPGRDHAADRSLLGIDVDRLIGDLYLRRRGATAK